MDYVHRVFGGTHLFLLSVPPENCSPHRNRENHYVNWLLSKIAIYPTFDKLRERDKCFWLAERVQSAAVLLVTEWELVRIFDET